MNELIDKPRRKRNNKVIYKAIAITVALVSFGEILDATQVFGEQAQIPIIIATTLISGVIVGISIVSANTGMAVKELVI